MLFFEKDWRVGIYLFILCVCVFIFRRSKELLPFEINGRLHRGVTIHTKKPFFLS